MRPQRLRKVAILVVAANTPGCFDGTPDVVDAGPIDVAAPIDLGASQDRPVPVDVARDVGPALDLGGEGREVVGVEIDPANAALTVRDASRPTLTFRAIGVRRDGTRAPLPTAVWSLGDPRLGEINGDGVFTVAGVGGGDVQVRATVTGARAMVLNATTNLSVIVRREVIDPLAPTLPMRFEGAMLRSDPARAARILYPLAGALMPNNAPPPVVQWERGARGDAFRVRLSKPHAVATAYVEHGGDGFPFASLVSADAWRILAETDRDDDLTITVDRWEMASGQVVAGAPLRMRLARGSVFGSVYYWNLLAGRMARIRPDAARADDLLPRPAARAADGVRCVACHTVSRDGRLMAAQVTTAAAGQGFVGGVFDLTGDLSADPAPTVATASLFQCASFSPDGARLVTCATGRWAGPLGMIDPRTGMGITVGGLPTERATQPEWSPDGRSIAYIGNVDLDAQGNPVRGDLSILRDPGGTPTIFDPPQVIHTGADLAMATPAGEADAWPTWSPDSRFIAFQHGAGAFSMTGPGALYLIAREGGMPWRLDRANGGAQGVESYRPTFSPFTTDEGGGRRLVWVAFFSRRDYGNAQVGTRGTRRRQIWVAAIEAAPRAGQDPSFTPYWLPGQDTATENMAGYWSAQACRMTSETCRTSADCCGGSCRPDPTMPGRFACQVPAPSECRRRGQTCGSNDDCCAGLMCFGNVCDMPPS